LLQKECKDGEKELDPDIVQKQVILGFRDKRQIAMIKRTQARKSQSARKTTYWRRVFGRTSAAVRESQQLESSDDEEMNRNS